MISPVWMTTVMFDWAIPWSMMRSTMRGWRRSMATSTIIISGARTAQYQ